MNAEEFDRVCQSTEYFLSRKHVPLAWFALTIFLPISEHPAHTQQYELNREAGSLPSIWECVRQGLLSFLRHVRRGRRSHSLTRFLRQLPRKRYSTILFSWLISPDHLSTPGDFYLGDMQRLLAENARDSLLVLGNASSAPLKDLVHEVADGPFGNRRMMPVYLGLWLELKIAFRTLWGLAVLACIRCDGFSRKLKQRAIKQLLLGYAAESLRFYEFFGRLFRRSKTNLFLTLYEGYSWERCVWRAARDANPGMLRIGYQHAVLRTHAFSMRHIPGGKMSFAPDRILTTGEIPANTLERETGIPCTVYGSVRDRGGVNLHPESLPRKVLVMPEGIMSECVQMIGFAMECSRVLHGVEFVVRLHPIMRFEQVESLLPAQLRDFSNIRISRSADLEVDLGACGFLLYRGTTAATLALVQGLRLVYLALPGEMSIDPLAGLTHYKSIVQDPAEMRIVLSASRDETEWRSAMEYCRRLSQPVQTDVIRTLCRHAEE